MTWRRKSVHSDGSPSGDRKFAFRQSPVPGVEANLTKISRNSHKQRPAFHRYSLCSNPPSQPLYGLFHDPEETKQSNRYLFTSLTRIHDPPPQRTQHAALRYSIHIRNMSVPHCWSPSPSHSIASNSFISFSMRSCLPALYFYQARYPHLHPHAAILILSCIILLLTLHLSCS